MWARLIHHLSNWVAEITPIDLMVICCAIPVMAFLISNRKNMIAMLFFFGVILFITDFFGANPGTEQFHLDWTKN